MKSTKKIHISDTEKKNEIINFFHYESHIYHIMNSIITDNADEMKKLISDYKIDCNLKFDGISFLMICAYMNSISCLKVLLKMNVNVNDIHDTKKATALMFACETGNVEIVEELLKHKDIDIDIQSSIYGHTAGLICVENNFYDIFYKITIQNIIITSNNLTNDIIWKTLNDGYAGVHISAQEGYIKMLETFKKIQNEIQNKKQNNRIKILPNVFDLPLENGKTPLMLCAINGHVKCTQYICNETNNINMTDNVGKTALMYAIKYHHVVVLHTLIKYKADVNFANKDGKTSLMYACNLGFYDCTWWLILFGANVNQVDKDKNSPLMFASMKGCSKCVEHLLKTNSDINHQNIQNITPLMMTCKYKHEHCTQKLINYDANINLQDKNGYNALMYAASVPDNVKIINLLLANNADLTQTSYNGKTPLMIAKENSNFENINILDTYKTMGRISKRIMF